jgi:hypothetical protein
LISSKWALESQKRIDQLYTNNPILIAFIPYEDGVTVDNNGNRSCDTVVGTFGNFSSQARHADFSKFHIGFIPKLEQENLLLNILEKRYDGNKSRANEELKIFKLKIRRDFYRLMFSTIKGIAENGNNICSTNYLCSNGSDVIRDRHVCFPSRYEKGIRAMSFLHGRCPCYSKSYRTVLCKYCEAWMHFLSI